MLSTLSTDEFTIPFHIVLKHLYLRQLVPSVFITAGALGAREEALLTKIEKQKIQVYKLNSEQKQGVVTLWNRSLKVPS